MLYFIILIFPLTCTASPNGTLNPFLDYNCARASVVNPSVPLPIDTCLVSSGAYGLAVKTLPPCSSGTAKVATYQDNSCANAIDPIETAYGDDNCYIDDSGSYIKAVAFVCPDVAGGSVPTSTTTATFGSSLIPIASGAPASKGGGQSTSPSSNNASPTSNPGSASPSSTTTTTPSNISNSDDGGGSGLSHGAVVGLGVGVPVATLLVALLAWWFPCKKIRNHGHGDNQFGGMSQPLYHQGPQYQPDVHASQWAPPINNYPQELPAERGRAIYR